MFVCVRLFLCFCCARFLYSFGSRRLLLCWFFCFGCSVCGFYRAAVGNSFMTGKSCCWPFWHISRFAFMLPVGATRLKFRPRPLPLYMFAFCSTFYIFCLIKLVLYLWFSIAGALGQLVFLSLLSINEAHTLSHLQLVLHVFKPLKSPFIKCKMKLPHLTAFCGVFVSTKLCCCINYNIYC